MYSDDHAEFIKFCKIDIACIYTYISCKYYRQLLAGSAYPLTDIRLVGGRTQYEGCVEVNRCGEWQIVCDNSWDIAEAEVVCRQLGYGYAILAIQGAAFGQGSGGQWDRV